MGGWDVLPCWERMPQPWVMVFDLAQQDFKARVGKLARERPSRFAVSNKMDTRESARCAGHCFVPHCQFRISGMSWP